MVRFAVLICICGEPITLVPFIRKIIFSSLYYLLPLSKTNWPYIYKFISRLLNPLLLSYVFSCANITFSWLLFYRMSWNQVVWILQLCFCKISVYILSFLFYINFIVRCSVSARSWNLCWNCIKLDHIGQNRYFNTLSFPHL